MSRIMFIANNLESTSGAGTVVRNHLKGLRTVVGEDEVYVINLSADSKPERRDKYIAYGKYQGKLERIRRIAEGNIFLCSNAISNEIAELVRQEQAELVFVDDSLFGKLIETLKKRTEAPVVTFYHDIKADLLPKWAKQGGAVEKVECRLGMQNEALSTRLSDRTIVLNRKDGRLLEQYYGRKADFYLPICVGRQEGAAGPAVYPENGRRHILFIGTSYHVNIMAMEWFAKEVLPGVRERYDLSIVGKGLECLRGKPGFDEPDVHVIGFVDSLAPYYAQADAVIAPLTEGGGMKVKTAEAVSWGKVFLGSDESLEGYLEVMPKEVIGQTVFACNTAEDYIRALQGLAARESVLYDERLTAVYEANYSPEAMNNTIRQIIESVKK